MGEHSNQPRQGFDYWASFEGQGQYWNSVFNVNGTEQKPKDSTYVTDAITDYAIDFLNGRDKNKPFFLYMSHKAVHSEFVPNPKDYGKYKNEKLTYPATMLPPDISGNKDYNYEDLPDWVKKQRYSWHGVNYMYHGAMDFDVFYKNYCETLLGIDESVGQVIAYLEKNGLSQNTTIIYMGDNGFSFGEHGLIDKRHAYEESMRVPLLVYGPDVKVKGATITANVQNIDIAPTILDMAKVSKNIWLKSQFDGQSFLPLLQNGQKIPWRDTIFYEYFWERPFPQTPTVHAIRTDQYKYIRYHGVWDINELYDIKNDPWEMNNLIRHPNHQNTAMSMREALFRWTKNTEGEVMFLRNDGKGARFDIGKDKSYKGTY